MAKEEIQGYKKFRATELPWEEQEQMRKAFQHDLTNELIRFIKANPPDVDLAEIELVLRPGQEIDDWHDVADCITCLTCVTCGTCGTS